jgi:hypothetical protein
MQFKKVYIPVNGISNRADFDCLYEDRTLFCRVTSLNKKEPWSDEHDQIALISRHDSEMGRIKPDFKSLTYDLRMERWNYTLHTYTIFSHYYVEGMMWQINKSPLEAPFTFYNEGYDRKDVRLRIADFADKGPCYEVAVKDVSMLRVAVISVLAILVKEEYRGLSEGEPSVKDKWYRKLVNSFNDKGVSFNDLAATGQIPEAVLEKIDY